MVVQIDYMEGDVDENRRDRDLPRRLQESIWKMTNSVMTT
jgi:hypothetical protein